MIEITDYNVEKREDDNSITYNIKVKVVPYTELIQLDFVIPNKEPQIE